MSADYADSRQAGERAESAVLELLPWLRYVTDETAEHYDAVAREECGRVEEGDPVEIKSVAVELADGAPGRFYLRANQHDRLVEEGGWYLFVVCTPNAKRRVLAHRFMSAAEVDGEISAWWDAGEGRQLFRQLRWPSLLDEESLDDDCTPGEPQFTRC